MVLNRVTTEEYEGPEVQIHCPACDQACPDASTAEVVETAKLLWFFPIFQMRNTYITCSNCGKGYSIKPRLEELADYTSDELSEMLLKSRASVVGTIFAILAVLCMALPHVNYVVALIAVLINLKSRGWQKAVSVIMLIVSIGISLWIVFG